MVKHKMCLRRFDIIKNSSLGKLNFDLNILDKDDFIIISKNLWL